MPSGKGCLPAQLCLLTLLLFVHVGVSQKENSEGPVSGAGASSEEPSGNKEEKKVTLAKEDRSSRFDCEEGYHFEPHIGCTVDPKEDSVSSETRVLVMVLAIIFGVGVPCLVLVGLCILWDLRKAEKETENDIEAKSENSKGNAEVQVQVENKK